MSLSLFPTSSVNRSHENQPNESSFNQPDNLISSETVQQVLLERRSPKVVVKSKLLSSIKGGDLLVEYKTEGQCRLRSMFLRLDELGWRNRVLAPRAFEFNYCEGNCKPIEFLPLPLIVQEGHRVKLKIYDDLLVSKCG